MARQLSEIIAAARAETDMGVVSTLCDELCDAAEQTDRWLVDAHVRAAREQDAASAERVTFNQSFRSLWEAFGDTVKQRDAAVLALREIYLKTTDASAHTLAAHALKLAQFDATDHEQGAA